MLEELKKYKKKFDDAVKHREKVSYTLDTLIRYASPQLEMLSEKDMDFSDKESNRRIIELYDTTLAQAMEEYVDTQKARMFPTTVSWFSAEVNPLLKDDISEEDKKDVQEIIKKTQNAMRLSNFDFILENILKDYNLSTAVTKISFSGDYGNPLVYESFPYTVTALGAPNPNGKIETVFIERPKLTYEQVLEQFPTIQFVDYDQEGERKDCLVRGKEEYNLVEFVIPSGKTMETKNGHIAKMYYYFVTDNDFNKVLIYEAYPYNPFVVSRISSTNNGARYGKSRASLMIPTFSSLNQLCKNELKSTNIDSNPPRAVILGGVSASMYKENTVEFRPGKATALPEGSAVMTITSGLDISQTRVKIQDLRNQIFDMLATRPLGTFEDTKYKTAQEMYQRERENERILTSRYATTIKQLSQPIVETTMAVLEYNDVFNFPKSFDSYILTFINPVTQNKKQEEVQKITAVFTLLKALYGVDITNVIMNDEEVIKTVIDSVDVDRKLLKSEDEIKEIINNMIQNIQLQQMIAASSQQQGEQK